MTSQLEAKSYISYKQLYLLEDEYDAVYLGYPFKVSKTEYFILKALINNAPKPLSAEKIAISLPLDIKASNIVYHICRINERANQIGNRYLIKNISKKGYFLNEEM